MSWLRDHFHHFVFPAFVCARSLQNASKQDIQKYFPVVLPEVPADKWINLPTELRKLNALAESMPKSQPLVGPNIFGSSLYSGFESWSPNNRGKLHFDIIKNALLSAESTRKALGCTKLLLAGRDVWAFEIMARKREIHSLYIPEISRKVVSDPFALRILLKEYGFTGNELLVDTGFMGSIPRGINVAMGTNLKFILMSQNPVSTSFIHKNNEQQHSGYTPDGKKVTYVTNSVSYKGQFPQTKEDERIVNRPNQIFPNRANARGEALETEYLPKYFASGTVREDKVIQYLASAEEIVAAAFMTSNIWRGAKYGRSDSGAYNPAPPKEENIQRKKVHHVLF